MKKKAVSAILCLLLVAGTLLSAASCGNRDGTASNDTTTAASDDGSRSETVTSEKAWLDNLPSDTKFGTSAAPTVIDFVIAECEQSYGMSLSERSVLADESAKNVVDNAVYSRNVCIEERLGIEVNIVTVKNNYLLNTEVDVAMASGDRGYCDIVSGYQAHDIMLATKGYILDVNSLANYDAENLIDISRPWWSAEYCEAMSYKGIMYWLTGELSLRYIGGTYCTYVNSAIYGNVLKEGYGKIYDVVSEGGWTIPLLTEMASKAFDDRGTEQGITDASDQLGFCIEKIDPLDGMSVGAGVSWSQVDASGNVSLVLAAEDNSTLEFCTAMKTLLATPGTYVPKSDHSNTMMTMFSEGNVLFACNKIYCAEQYLGEMTDDYYIIPLPKLNVKQTAYRSAVHDGCSLYGIYYMSDNVPAAAATLEALSAESYRTVSPQYYDLVLKTRYTRDPDAASMIDLIRDGAYVDFAFAWGRSLENIHNWFRTNMDNPSSALKRSKNIWTQDLENLTASLEAYTD